MTYRDIVRPQLRIDEDWRNKLYKDTVGKWSIGCGRNLDDVGLRDDEIAYLLENDITEAERGAKALFKCFGELTPNRQAVVVNMCFNLGKERLSGFVKFRTAVEAGDYNKASQEMLSSKWAEQVGQRAVRLATQMRSG